jgi:hypothetical protein
MLARNDNVAVPATDKQKETPTIKVGACGFGVNKPPAVQGLTNPVIKMTGLTNLVGPVFIPTGLRRGERFGYIGHVG